jgi:hypothetical protein
VRAEAAAVLTRLRTDPNLTVYDTDEIPPLPTTPYVVVLPSRREGGYYRRLADWSDTKGYRVVTIVAGGTADEARWAEEHVEARLEGVRLTVAGTACSAVHYESSGGVVLDAEQEGIYSGSTTWTFVSTQQS